MIWRTWNGFLTLWTIQYRSSLFCTPSVLSQQGPEPNRNSNRAQQKLYLFVRKSPSSQGPPRPESPTVASGPSTPCSRLPLRRLRVPPCCPRQRRMSSVSHRQRSRRESPRPKPAGPSFSEGAVIARCRKRHSGGPARWARKHSATLAGFGTSRAGFFRSTGPHAARPSPWKFTQTATVRCWR